MPNAKAQSVGLKPGVEGGSASSESLGGLWIQPPLRDVLSRLRGVALRLDVVLAVPVVLALCGLVLASLYLGAMRIFQVDECCNIRAAYEVAMGQGGSRAIDLYQYLLSLVVHGGQHSIDWFIQGRFIMVEVFWLNIILVALATGVKLTRPAGLWVLLGAATLAPLWDYGFELRHDNLLLTGLLFIWCVVRHSRRGMGMYAVAGGVAVVSLSIAVKSAAYVFPLLVALFLVPSAELTVPRWKLILACLAGSAGTLIVLMFTYGRAGFLGDYMHGVANVASISAGGAHFRPWITLVRLLTQTPLLSGVTAAGLLAVLAKLWRTRKSVSVWNSPAPEAFLVLVAVITLFANPTPYPYNLINVVPFMFLFAYRFGSDVLTEVWKMRELRVVIVGVIVFTHFVPFLMVTKRHKDRLNWRQEKLMTLAEDISDPVKDPVYDVIGMVPTRSVVSRESYIHGNSVHRFYEENGPHLRDMLAANPAVVIIRSYRTDWLPQADREFIDERYVPLSDDFEVLGKILPQGGGEVEIIHPGRYRVASLKASDLAGTYPEGWGRMILTDDGPEFDATVNGVQLKDPVVTLGVGPCQIKCNPDVQPTVVWVGPNKDRLPRLLDVSHQDLFVNWY